MVLPTTFVRKSRTKPGGVTRLNRTSAATYARRYSRLVLGGLGFVLGAHFLNAQAANPAVDYAAFKERLAVGEYAIVANQLDSHIHDMRIDFGNFDSRLVEPYVLLGEAQLGMDQAEDAVDSFEMALSIQRATAGLNAEIQVDTLYRLSDALQEVRDYQGANINQERAYAIMLRKYGNNDTRLLPAMLKLIDWYESNRRYYAAKILYLDAIRLARTLIPPNDSRRVELARAFAIGMRNTVFPPLNDRSPFRGFDVNVPGYEPTRGTSLPSSYSLGQTALKNVIQRLESHTDTDPKEIAIAKLQLADWHQLFGRESRSTRLYREIWAEMDSFPNLRSQIFDQPKLLYVRLPQLIDEASSDNTGLVELLLTISYRGAVTGRISQTVDPRNDTIEHFTRMAAREARFRPAFREGRPVTVKGYLLTHRYPLRRSRG